MKLSFNWLSDYVDLDGLSPQTVAERLTAAGLEVEGVDDAPLAFEGVILAKVLATRQHPNADRLKLVDVALSPKALNAQQKISDAQQKLPEAQDTPEADAQCIKTVVCGAPNVAEGMRIAFAPTGARVFSPKTGEAFELTPVSIRGVASEGMICSLDELGLAEVFPQPEGGIWNLTPLTQDAQLGEPLAHVLEIAPDAVLHTAPTANRGDWMSVMGIAQEVSALFERPLTMPDWPSAQALNRTDALKIILENNATAGGPSESIDCLAYSGLQVTHVHIAPSPPWLARRLLLAGIRPINNVVDVTNYVLLELGQPLHAFDLTKLGASGALGVRNARTGEFLETLDGQTRHLTPDALLITKDDAPVALAGVMGGNSTAVSEHTGALLLESAVFNARSVRISARSTGLRSESSARFERGVDPAKQQQALLRAAGLIKQLAGRPDQAVQLGALAEARTQAFEALFAQEPILLRLNTLSQVAGMPIDAAKARKTLEWLGFTVNQNQYHAEQLLVRVPSHRAKDVTREVDVIEEILRVSGYDAIAETMPVCDVPVSISPRQAFIRKLHQSMQGAGLNEAVTNSLEGMPWLKKVGLLPEANRLVTLSNAHAEDTNQMRQSMMPSLLSVLLHNQGQGASAAWLYELGRVYHKKPGVYPSAKMTGVSEGLKLAGALYGVPQFSAWQPQGTQVLDFYRLKGVLMPFFKAFGLERALAYEPLAGEHLARYQAFLHPGQTAQVVTAQGEYLGFAGRLHPERQQALKFRQPVWLFELDADALLAMAAQAQRQEKPFMLPSPYPAVDRDLAFKAERGLTHQSVVAAIEGLDEPLLTEIKLFDEYVGEKVADHERSLAYRLVFQSPERTLTDAEVNAASERIREHLARTFEHSYALSLR
ncbi:MAG: phenylalanine--tRNA ligase subunit beta [Vampirovibrionales bacterium]|nr:phenylalanine--tRNA ligase subunit beta [Vampirovibrionales bacterium]